MPEYSIVFGVLVCFRVRSCRPRMFSSVGWRAPQDPGCGFPGLGPCHLCVVIEAIGKRFETAEAKGKAPKAWPKAMFESDRPALKQEQRRERAGIRGRTSHRNQRRCRRTPAIGDLARVRDGFATARAECPRGLRRVPPGVPGAKDGGVADPPAPAPGPGGAGGGRRSALHRAGNS